MLPFEKLLSSLRPAFHALGQNNIGVFEPLTWWKLLLIHGIEIILQTTRYRTQREFLLLRFKYKVKKNEKGFVVNFNFTRWKKKNVNDKSKNFKWKAISLVWKFQLFLLTKNKAQQSVRKTLHRNCRKWKLCGSGLMCLHSGFIGMKSFVLKLCAMKLKKKCLHENDASFSS